MMQRLQHRQQWACALALVLALGGQSQAQAQAGAALPPWQLGNLDIHHLGTGRGNATFVVFPDGTSMLYDAGATASTLDESAAPKPNGSRRPGEWIARYVKRHLPRIVPARLDYVVISHFHPDHLGDVNKDAPRSRQGNYRLGGVMDVAEEIPVTTLIDRGFPDYSYPTPIQNMGMFAENYLQFVAARRQAQLPVQRVVVGSDTQIHPLHAAVPRFSVRAIAANGEVWDGKAATVQKFPALASLPPNDYPNENACSVALKISYGKFAYFTAGDLTSYSFDGELPWRDVLGAAAAVAGPVDVATADHHGMFDGLSADVVRHLRPRAWMIPAWHISHPDMLQLERMFSQRLYAGPRDVYANGVMAPNQLANHRLLARARALDGHIVVRVAPGGATFTVFVTDNKDERDSIVRADGPFTSGQQ
jgi:hypothetical protein